MLSFLPNGVIGLWWHCVQTCGLTVFIAVLIHKAGANTDWVVYITGSFTTKVAQLLYSVFHSKKPSFIPVGEILMHPIHRTYNYLQQSLRNILLLDSGLIRRRDEA